jgi:hypothetical protein
VLVKKLYWKLKLLLWIYSGEDEEYCKVTLSTGEVFYKRPIQYHRLTWDTQYFFEGKSGSLIEIQPHVTDSVYREMFNQREF